MTLPSNQGPVLTRESGVLAEPFRNRASDGLGSPLRLDFIDRHRHIPMPRRKTRDYVDTHGLPHEKKFGSQKYDPAPSDPPVFPDWMRNPALLPKKPPGFGLKKPWWE
jgi:hypothetical protein